VGELVSFEEGLCVGESVDKDKINRWTLTRGRIGQRGAGHGRIGGLCQRASRVCVSGLQFWMGGCNE
jgi:hypothetical protein